MPASRTILLTQDEVAERLRKSTSTVARLRREGKLAYLPGRPVLISEAELERYLRREQERKELKARKTPIVRVVGTVFDNARTVGLTPRAQAQRIRAQLSPESRAYISRLIAEKGPRKG